MISSRTREGTRVRFEPTPASYVLYSSPPRRGATGTVTSVSLGRGKRTYLPGPGGGLLYVQWDDGSFQGVSTIDLVKVKHTRVASNPARRIGPHPGNPRNLEVGDFVQFRWEPETGGVIQRFERDSYGLHQGWAWVDTRKGLRKVPTHALRLRHMSGTYDENPISGGTALTAVAILGAAWLLFRKKAPATLTTVSPTPPPPPPTMQTDCVLDEASLNAWGAEAGISIWIGHPSGAGTVVGVQNVSAPTLYWKVGETFLRASNLNGPKDALSTANYCAFRKTWQV